MSACPTGTSEHGAECEAWVAIRAALTVAFTYNNAARNVRVRAKVGSGCPPVQPTASPCGHRPSRASVRAPMPTSAEATATATPVTKGSVYILADGHCRCGRLRPAAKADPTLDRLAERACGWPRIYREQGRSTAVPLAAWNSPPQRRWRPKQAGSFTYDEAGYFRFGPTACMTTPSPSTRAISSGLIALWAVSRIRRLSGKYGCGFGNASPTSYFGRFISIT